MPTPLARGIIITVSVLVAAGIAAYESPQVREWVERSREKIAIALHSLGDDIHPSSPRASRDDPTMREDQSEKAEERRRQMREEIMEKGRRMEERMRRRKTGSDRGESEKKRTPSFDNLVDEQGNLRPRKPTTQSPTADSTAVEAEVVTNGLRPRHVQQPNPQPQVALHESVDAPILLRQLEGPHVQASEPWESQYEREMRTSWNISLPDRATIPSSHASESLIDLTPTTEGTPDPDFSVPSAPENGHLLDQGEYFSFPNSRRSQTISEAGESDFYYAHPDQPLTPLEPRPMEENATRNEIGSSAASVAGSTTYVHASDLESEDDFSEFGDGIRTPGSVWTDVDSTISGDN